MGPGGGSAARSLRLLEIPVIQLASLIAEAAAVGTPKLSNIKGGPGRDQVFCF